MTEAPHGVTTADASRQKQKSETGSQISVSAPPKNALVRALNRAKTRRAEIKRLEKKLKRAGLAIAILESALQQHTMLRDSSFKTERIQKDERRLKKAKVYRDGIRECLNRARKRK